MPDLNDNVLYRLGFTWPSVRVTVEHDGYAAHGARQDTDTVRDADLRRRGMDRDPGGRGGPEGAQAIDRVWASSFPASGGAMTAVGNSRV